MHDHLSIPERTENSLKTTAVLAMIVVLAACEGGSSTRDTGPDGTPPPVQPPAETWMPPTEIPEAIASFCRPPREAQADPLPAGAVELPVRRVNGGDSELHSAMDCVVRTPAEWVALVSTAHMYDLPGVGPIRFDREVVLVAALGDRPSSGYSIDIDSVVVSGGTVVAVVHSSSAGGAQLAALTAPFTAVAVPAPADSVVFLRRP
jgi:hypothetical protein